MENESQTVCDTCNYPVREYLSGWQHVYKTIESQHEITGVHEIPLT